MGSTAITGRHTVDTVTFTASTKTSERIKEQKEERNEGRKRTDRQTGTGFSLISTFCV